MSYLFILVLIWACVKLFILKNVVNKKAYIFLCLAVMITGVMGILFDYSIADVLRRWL